MPLPFYVSPEQMMQDKAEYAQKGIAKGRAIIATEYRDGILLIADNPASSLNKISEIYDKIAFAGAGKYSEFENLRKAGIRHADLKGYAYSREDVTAKSLANAYSQTIGTIFSQELKPLEVEILVVAVDEVEEQNELYRISFDGSIAAERGFTAIGGRSDAIKLYLKDRYRTGMAIGDSLNLAVEAMESVTNQKITTQGLEVAVLERNRSGRKFRRLLTSEVERFRGKPR